MSEETTLADLRVLDLSTSAAGAFCARLFADYGADVIAIAPPGAPPTSLAEGKRSIALNIGKPSGAQLFRAMVEKAMVVIETFPDGTLGSYGLGFAELQAIKRRIILVSFDSTNAQPDGEHFAGLHAFAAAALAAFNADSHEIPQHIRISTADCLAAARGFPAGGAVANDAPFTISTVEWARGDAPTPGEHTAEIFAELHITAEEMEQLRAEGVV